MNAKRFITVVLLALIGCSSSTDGIKDEDLVGTLTREAMCIAAAERFYLYEEAQKHLNHGLEADQIYYATTGKSSHFLLGINTVRLSATTRPKEFSATVLSTKCGRSLTVAEFNSAQ